MTHTLNIIAAAQTQGRNQNGVKTSATLFVTDDKKALTLNQINRHLQKGGKLRIAKAARNAATTRMINAAI